MTVYLAAQEDFQSLLDIASGAKFNIEKTELIPTGSLEHRDKVRTTRRVNGVDGTVIPEHIKIAKEGEPIRTLGPGLATQ
jgi:hypothetical protein